MSFTTTSLSRVKAHLIINFFLFNVDDMFIFMFIYNLRRKKEYNHRYRYRYYLISSLRWHSPTIPQKATRYYCWRKPYFRSTWSVVKKKQYGSIIIYHYFIQNVRSLIVNTQFVIRRCSFCPFVIQSRMFAATNIPWHIWLIAVSTFVFDLSPKVLARQALIYAL